MPVREVFGELRGEVPEHDLARAPLLFGVRRLMGEKPEAQVRSAFGSFAPRRRTSPRRRDPKPLPRLRPHGLPNALRRAMPAHRLGAPGQLSASRTLGDVPGALKALEGRRDELLARRRQHRYVPLGTDWPTLLGRREGNLERRGLRERAAVEREIVEAHGLSLSDRVARASAAPSP